MESERTPQFTAPAWLRNVGFSSWLLTGFVLIMLGLIWVLDQTSTIVMPVIAAAVLGAVAGPAVGWLEGHRVPRIGGAVLVLLGLVAIGVLIFCLVFGGISANSGEISAHLNQSLDKIQGWLSDLGIDNAQSAKKDVQEAAPEIRTTLLSGVAEGIGGLKSLVFFLAFATLSTLFVLKDGPVMRAFINRHMGVPQRDAEVVTDNVAKSLRSYFLGVTIIAAFNGVVIGLAAWIVGVPLAGTIAVVTFVGRLRALRRRVGRRRLRGADRTRHRGHGRRDCHGGRLAACEQRASAGDPTVRDGRDAEPQPARGAGRHDRRRGPVRDGRAHARRPAHLGGRAHRQRAAGPERWLVERRPSAGAVRITPPESSGPAPRVREISSHVGVAPDAIGRWNGCMTRKHPSKEPSPTPRGLLRSGLLVAVVLLIAAAAVGCGESDEEKAQTQVCDARADLKKQVDDLAGLTVSTATVDGVEENLNAIEDDLNQIKDAQGDLNEERKQEVESATQEFSSEVEAVANDLTSDLSLSGAQAKLDSAGKQLASSYQQTFAQIDCE